MPSRQRLGDDRSMTTPRVAAGAEDRDAFRWLPNDLGEPFQAAMDRPKAGEVGEVRPQDRHRWVFSLRVPQLNQPFISDLGFVEKIDDPRRACLKVPRSWTIRPSRLDIRAARAEPNVDKSSHSSTAKGLDQRLSALRYWPSAVAGEPEGRGFRGGFATHGAFSRWRWRSATPRIKQKAWRLSFGRAAFLRFASNDAVDDPRNRDPSP